MARGIDLSTQTIQQLFHEQVRELTHRTVAGLTHHTAVLRTFIEKMPAKMPEKILGGEHYGF